MENYSEVLKNRIMQPKSMFIYGNENERKEYLAKLATRYRYNNEEEQQHIVIYTNNQGLEDCKNNDYSIELAQLYQKDYFEVFTAHQMFIKLMQELPEEKISKIEKQLNNLFVRMKLKSIEELVRILKESVNSHEQFYKEYNEKGEKFIFGEYTKLKIFDVKLFSLLSKIKRIIPNISDFTLIIDKKEDLGDIYTRVINSYLIPSNLAASSLKVKIGCKNNLDWKNYYTCNGDLILPTHDYDEIYIEDYKLNRVKKEQ